MNAPKHSISYILYPTVKKVSLNIPCRSPEQMETSGIALNFPCPPLEAGKIIQTPSYQEGSTSIANSGGNQNIPTEQKNALFHDTWRF